MIWHLNNTMCTCTCTSICSVLPQHDLPQETGVNLVSVLPGLDWASPQDRVMVHLALILEILCLLPKTLAEQSADYAAVPGFTPGTGSLLAPWITCFWRPGQRSGLSPGGGAGPHERRGLQAKVLPGEPLSLLSYPGTLSSLWLLTRSGRREWAAGLLWPSTSSLK